MLAVHSVQVPASDAAENFPAAHAVHAVAPTLGPVLVMDPAAQSVQASAPDAIEYLPAAHVVHTVAPGLDPVFVIDPASHPIQPVAVLMPSTTAYLPVPQSLHVFTIDTVEYLPATQAVHVEAVMSLAEAGGICK